MCVTYSKASSRDIALCDTYHRTPTRPTLKFQPENLSCLAPYNPYQRLGHVWHLPCCSIKSIGHVCDLPYSPNQGLCYMLDLSYHPKQSLGHELYLPYSPNHRLSNYDTYRTAISKSWQCVVHILHHTGSLWNGWDLP